MEVRTEKSKIMVNSTTNTSAVSMTSFCRSPGLRTTSEISVPTPRQKACIT
ncbi:hypothetical protein DPMN_096289 [Dreissena polymorpha]|uniref:Uncharacterized protein n=1 Tax=Dreissena polymorpha TaxID=45954 RepID=A0A9D4R4L4_DREPO|nr:hypothetical protein DPMN_096289 [Dreissena polymorpha]